VEDDVGFVKCRWRPAAGIVFTALCLSRCVGVTRTQQYGIEVKRGATTKEQLQVAKSVVTQARLDRLKSEIRRQMPAVPDAALERMGLRWNQTTFHPFTSEESRAAVLVLVVMEECPGVDAKAVVEAAAVDLRL
jgi:hypothetical protein